MKIISIPKMEIIEKKEKKFKSGGEIIELTFKIIDYPISHPEHDFIKECITLLKCRLVLSGEKVSEIKSNNTYKNIQRIIDMDIDAYMLENYFVVNFPLNHKTVKFNDMDKTYREFCIKNVNKAIMEYSL